MRNPAGKVPEDVWPDFKVRAQAAYQAPSRAIARELAAGVVADYGRKYDSAVACFMDDFEACIAHLRFPVTHRRAIRTTDEMDKHFLTSKARGSLLQVRFLFDRASGVLSSRPPILLPPRAGAVKAGRVLRGHRKAWP